MIVRGVPIWMAAMACGAVVSCGSRTGLFSDEGVGSVNNGPDGMDGSTLDGSVRIDARLDALPPIDVVVRPDANRTGCADPSETYVYVVSEEQELFSFFPPTLTFTSIGKLVCPSAPGETPFSMAVDRQGLAYVVYTDGSLFRVSLKKGACMGTSYVPLQHGWRTFGMGFASDFGGPEEHLFVAENNLEGLSAGLGRIDLPSARLDIVGGFQPAIPRAELTGTGDGRLFAFWPNRGDNGQTTGSHVAEIEKSTAAVVAQTDLSIARSSNAFAFAFWGGDFWIFTGEQGSSTVTRFRPSDGTTVEMTSRPSTIVGAGVSTCAPQD